MDEVKTSLKKKSSEYKLLTGLFFRLLPYQILLLIITAVNGIIDSLYASNVIGETAMTAIGLFGPLNHFLYAVSILFVGGSQVLYGQHLERNREKINHLFTVTLTISGGLGILIAVLLAISVFTGLSGVLVNTEPELKMLNDYILGQAIGIPALILGQQLFSFMSLENRRKWTMLASILCFAANWICDHLFVAVSSWGTFGLGFSTSVSEVVFFFVLAFYYFLGRSEWRFSLKKCEWQDTFQIFKIGYSGALSRFLEMFRCLIVNALILAYVGSVGLSSFAASNSVMAVCWPVTFGIVAVARMLFSISVGEEDRKSLVDTMKIVMSCGLLLVLVIVVLLVVLAEPLTRLFYHDPSEPVYSYTVMGLRLLPLCMPLALWSLTYVPYAQAAGKRVISMVLPIVEGMAGVVTCSIFLIPVMQMNGLYISNILNGVICFLVTLIGAWIVLKRFPLGMEDMMAIPKHIGVGPDERIDISVTNEKEVANVSLQVDEFCRKRGIDKRRAFFASLCLEEMAGNIVEHGFTKDRKRHNIDIRVVHKDNRIILRIRDNCIRFDPSERHKSMQPDEYGKNIGIRLVYGIADEVKYQNLLGMNILTIRL